MPCKLARFPPLGKPILKLISTSYILVLITENISTFLFFLLTLSLLLYFSFLLFLNGYTGSENIHLHLSHLPSNLSIPIRSTRAARPNFRVLNKGPSENRSDNANVKMTLRGKGKSHGFGIDVKKKMRKSRRKGKIGNTDV